MDDKKHRKTYVSRTSLHNHTNSCRHFLAFYNGTLYLYIYIWRYITYIWKYALTLIWRLVDNRLIRHAMSARFAYERPPSITYYQARHIYDEKLCWFNHFEPILWFFWMLSESFTLLITNIPKRTVCGHSTRITQVLIWAFVFKISCCMFACLHTRFIHLNDYPGRMRQ